MKNIVLGRDEKVSFQKNSVFHVLLRFVCPTVEAVVDYPPQQCCCWQKQGSLPVHQWAFLREASLGHKHSETER